MSICLTTECEQEGVVKFPDDWGFEGHEKLCVPVFEEAINNTLAHDPPSMHVDTDESGDDVLLTFCLFEDGPNFVFSMEDAVKRCDYSGPEDVALLSKALRRLADHADWIAAGCPQQVYYVSAGGPLAVGWYLAGLEDKGGPYGTQEEAEAAWRSMPRVTDNESLCAHFFRLHEEAHER
jgi:hypothetical protein